MFKSVLKKRDGAALVVVLLLLMVFSISYGGAVYVSNKNIEGSVQTQKYTQTYYSSESGINVMVELDQKGSNFPSRVLLVPLVSLRLFLMAE